MMYNILLFIGLLLIAGGVLNLILRMILALIEDEEWGFLAILLGITILIASGIAYSIHVYSLGR